MVAVETEIRPAEKPIARISETMNRLLLNESLAKYTSWRVGGLADRFYRPENRKDLQNFLSELPVTEPIFWMGLGSNLLVRDGGIRGTVINLRGRLSEIHLESPGSIYVEAGVQCPQVAKFCSENGLSGGEFLSGIPGTMGGALAMNAGAFGGETWQLVDSVHSLDKTGRCHLRNPDEYKIAYRSVSGPEGEWFVGAKLNLKRGAKVETREKIRALLTQRADTQPLNKPSCGSVFRNPPGDHAARLIEACGLKGYSIGGALVSDKHANFIVNSGAANANDIESLIRYVQTEVERKKGVKLITEVHIVGEHTPKDGR